MSSYIQNLMAYSRDLPVPYDTQPKKVPVKSIYGDKTESTLSASVIKAIHAICDCKAGKREGAVGVQDAKCIAEYKSSVGADTYHLVVYSSDTGNIVASVYDKSSEIVESYELNATKRDGSAVIMALYPVLMTDAEFKDKFNEYFTEYQAGLTDLSKATNVMAILCDNVYRRLKDESCAAHVKTNLDRAGNLMRISRTQLDSEVYKPKQVVVGEFTIFAKTATDTSIGAAEIVVEHEDFVGKYEMHKRELTREEQMLVPKLPAWYIIPQEAVDICRHAQLTTGKAMQMRNFLLRGPAGTGKTMAAKAIAAGLGLPYVKYTCSAGTEIFDFIGQILPDSHNEEGTATHLGSSLKANFTYDELAKQMNLPDVSDMDYDPVGTYKAMTGKDKADATTQDCMQVALQETVAATKKLMPVQVQTKEGGQTFSYTDTDFLKALKNGYVVEIQEPTTIMQPGVLVGLNSLLEQEGSITLPTGQVIERHPDAVVIVTTNVDYEGCRGLNQSVSDRMSMIMDIEAPTQEVMVQRAMSVTDETDENMVSQMVRVIYNIMEYCKKNSVLDGSVGMRSLISWIESTKITGDPYKSALTTVISKSTADEDARAALITSALEQEFLETRKVK